jgi:hypothetical protein
VVEHFLGKEEVVSSILINGSGFKIFVANNTASRWIGKVVSSILINGSGFKIL